MTFPRIYVWPLALLSCLAPAALLAQSTAEVTVNVSYSNPAAAIPADFEGMSFEIAADEYNFTGGTNPSVGWFDGTAGPFSTMMKTIGIKSIRFGGDTMENGQFPYPSSLDGAHANDFANLIGANMIWSIPVGATYNATTFANFAGSLIANKASKNQTFETVFEVGNEPDDIPVSSATYDSRFNSYLTALKSTVGSSVLLGGADPGSNRSYDSNLEADAGVDASKENIAYIFAHNYPEGGANSYPSPAAAIDKLLSSGNDATFLNNYNGWGPSAVSAGFKPRYDETNSMYNGGFVGASNTFAASLWSLDYLSFLATQTKVAGMNFHEGESNNAYNAIYPVGIQSSYTLQGIGYGLLAFNQFSHGSPVPVTISNPSNVNLTAYSVRQSDGSECVVVINRTHSSSTATDVNATVTIDAGNNYQTAQVMYLQATNSDPTTLTGITLGGQGVTSTGTWSGGYTTTTSIVGGVDTVSVPHTSAAIIRFSGSGTPSLISNGTYVITSVNSGMALDDPGSSKTDGKDMQQYTVNNGTNQQWTVNNLGDNVITLTNVSSGQALDVAAGSQSNSALVDQYPYQGNPWQQWQVISLSGGTYELMNAHSGLALDVIGGKTTAGDGIDQYTYQGKTWQQWKFGTQ